MKSTTNARDRKRRNGLAAFRAVELEVHAALSAGRTVLAIYDEKRDRLGMSYAQFARYAQPLRRSIRASDRTPRAIAGAPDPLRPVAERRSPPAAETGPPRGRPEDAVPTLDMDRFAAHSLKNEDLF